MTIAECRRTPPCTPFWVGDYVTTVAGKYVKDAFNAGAIYIYELPRDNSSFKRGASGSEITGLDSFKNIIRIYIVKEGGSFCDILLLLTDEGKTNVFKYIGDFSGNIRFDRKKINETWERHLSKKSTFRGFQSQSITMQKRSSLEVDFVCDPGSRRYHIQSS